MEKMSIEEIQKQNPNKNIRWIVWKSFYPNEKTIHFIEWLDEKWDEFFKLKFGKIYDFLVVSDNLEKEFDNWLIKN